MCFAIMMQTTKRIFYSSYLCIAIFVFILYISVYIISGPTSNKNTAINEKNNKHYDKWIYNLDKKKRETVLPTKSFEDLNTFDTYFDLKSIFPIIVIIITIVVVLIFCYICRKIVSSFGRVDPTADRCNMPVHFRNNRIAFGSGEHSLDDETES